MAQSRKPDNVHRLNGTYRADKHGDPDTKPDWSTDVPVMPDYLDEYAQEEWNRVMEDAPEGVLTKTDMIILAQYCVMVSAMVQSCLGDSVFLAADHTQLRLIQQELGFTPISRGKIGGTAKKPDEDGFQNNVR